MAQYTITASSVKKAATVSNTDTRMFPSPAEFATQADADAQAAKYAKNLNYEDYEGVWDWVGKATLVVAAPTGATGA
jgi:hypothetical protein